MKLSIASPKGVIANCEVDYVVVDGNSGQLAILDNHVPVVVPITNGFVKSVINDEGEYYALSGAILEFSNGVVNVITQEVAEGKDYKEAVVSLEANRAIQKSENRRKMMDFTEMEKELALNLKEIKASKL